MHKSILEINNLEVDNEGKLVEYIVNSIILVTISKGLEGNSMFDSSHLFV